MNNNSLTISDMASALGGAGLTQLAVDVKIALLLIGVGVLLKVMVAFLNKKGIEVSAHPEG